MSGAAGNATGRNIHQRTLDEAMCFCNAIYAVAVENAGVGEALHICKRKQDRVPLRGKQATSALAQYRPN